MQAGAVVVLVYGPHGVRKNNARKASRGKAKQRELPMAKQCKGCEVFRCSRRDSGLMARDEIFAETNNLPLPECSDREPDFWERMVNE